MNNCGLHRSGPFSRSGNRRQGLHLATQKQIMRGERLILQPPKKLLCTLQPFFSPTRSTIISKPRKKKAFGKFQRTQWWRMKECISVERRPVILSERVIIAIKAGWAIGTVWLLLPASTSLIKWITICSCASVQVISTEKEKYLAYLHNNWSS